MTSPVNSQPAAASTAATGQTRNEADLRRAAEAFEAVFLRQVIGSMRQAKLADDLFGSQATEQFRDMADVRLADTMAGRGSFGIAELLLQQFGRGQAAAVQPAQPAAEGTSR